MKNDTKITVDCLITYYGLKNDTELGNRINLNKASISKWRRKGIPPKRQAVFEIITKGKLKADLSKYVAAK